MQDPGRLASYSHTHAGVLDMGWEGFGRLAKDLVEKIARDYRPEAVVGIAKGGVVPGVVIASALTVNFFPIKLSSRDNEVVVREMPELFVPPTPHLGGKRVLVVDDMCVRMRTLKLARRAVEAVGASEVRCATLAVHSFSEKPEWYALETDALIFFPWDKQVYAGNEWRLNPELAAELP